MSTVIRKALAISCIGIGAVVTVAHAADDEPLKNWFNDPYFQIRNGAAHCPLPRGPLLTEAEMKRESHSRVERGTSCWMAGTCAQPNAYLYDAAIGKSLLQQFSASTAFGDTSLWITVKRRFVWVEGCVSNPAQANQLEVLVKSVPDVERVIVNVMTDQTGTPPYPLLDRPH